MELTNRPSSSWNETLRRRRLPILGNDYEADSFPVLRLKGRRTELLELRNYAYSSLAGGVRTLIALHHGRKMKRESLASCRGRVNISGSKIAWINVECNGDSLSVAVPFESVCGPTGLLLFVRDKFIVRRQLKRLRKNRNCSLTQESIHLAAVTLTADGRVDNIKFASYLTGNRPLTCKRIIMTATL